MPKGTTSKPRMNPLDLIRTKHVLNSNELDTLLSTLEQRFHATAACHPNTRWDTVEQRLRNAPEATATLAVMELTGGEPTVVEFHHASAGSDNTILSFADCAVRSPRTAVCYDAAALESRKTAKPVADAQTVCEALGSHMLTRDEYEYLQTCIDIDTATSSWLATPLEIRALGGAIFGDKRYNTTFVYHNGAESYYSSRGVRTRLDIQ